MATIASQNFNALTDSALTTDSLVSGSQLTNAGSFNSGGPGLDFITVWFESDNTSGSLGPVTATSDSSDFIGVNSFSGSNSPDVAADGTPVASGSEQNFEFNDGDGRLELVFEPVNLAGFENRTLSFNYWINDTGFEANDSFGAALTDGTTVTSLFTFGELDLEANASADDGTANWQSVSFAIDPSLGDTLSLIISADTNSGSENIFVDDIVFAGEADVPDLAINEMVVSTSSTDQEFVELFGDSGTSLDGVYLLEVESGGVIDTVIDFSGGALDGDGFFLAASPEAEVDLGVTGDQAISNNTFTNNSQTYLLVQDFTGASGDDLDSDNDGTVDMTPWSAQLDDVAFIENDSPIIYSDNVLGPDGSFLAPGGFRDPDGNGDFTIHAFGDNSGYTPGATNGTVAPPPPPVEVTPIAEIQGAGHVSPFVLGAGQTVADFFDNLPGGFNVTGDEVTTQGIVTAVDSNGFYLQDPNGDGNDATSEAIFVFTNSAPTVTAGQSVTVSGTVSEFFPGGTDTRNIPLTQLINPTVTLLDESLGTVEATLIGSGGRVPPARSIDDDAFSSFDPAADGIDFFESLEAMVVTAQDLVAVAGTNRFGEIFAVADNGSGASGISNRGTLNISPDDFNPEKIQIDEDSGILNFDFPDVNVGDSLGDVTGVVSYSFGNFEILPTVDFTGNITSAGLQPEATSLSGGADQLTVASYNVLNLDPNDGDGDTDVADGRFDAIATQIVDALNAPDVIGLQEIQDNSGADNDGTVAADQTLQQLVDAIAAAGGPTYEFIDNSFIGDNTSGGQPGGNIRTAFLYNPGRVSLVPDSVQTIGSQDPGAPFAGARLPLVASFEFNGEAVTLVNNHFSSKGGSAPILGIEQDFTSRQEDVSVNGSLDERQAQSAAVQAFVDGLLAADGNANVVVLGDLNEFEFVSPVTGFENNFTNLVNTLPADERYSFIFQGNSQQLDHILISDSLTADAEFDVVHTNSELAETDGRASDHDPLVARLTITAAGGGDNGGDATAFVDANGILQGDVFFAEQPYDGRLFTNTDGSGNPDDVVAGTSDDDNIWAGLTGDDVINSGEGNDTVGVSDGDVQIDTGSGDDFVYSTGDGAGTNTIDLGTGNNRLWLTGGDNTITAAAGDDEIGLGDGTDSVEAGDGNNVIYRVDPNGTDDGDKDIITGLGNDWVKTGSGDDRLDLGTNSGGPGAFDTAFGQGGGDTFVLNAGGGWLTVGDFTQGEDVLEISGISFGDIGSSYNADRDSTWVWENVGGDVLAELRGFSGSLTAGDFASPAV